MSYVDWIRVFGNHEMLLFYLMGISCILAIQFISEFSCGQFSVLCVRSLICIVRLGTSDFSCSLRELQSLGLLRILRIYPGFFTEPQTYVSYATADLVRVLYRSILCFGFVEHFAYVFQSLDIRPVFHMSGFCIGVFCVWLTMDSPYLLGGVLIVPNSFSYAVVYGWFPIKFSVKNDAQILAF